MSIDKKSLAEFRKLYQEEFGKYLSEDDAREMITRLINLYKIIYSPFPGEHGNKPTPFSEDRLDPSVSLE